MAQERSHAFALKSLMWLLDPRPNLSTIVDDGGARLRAFGGLEYAGDDGAADPRLPRTRSFQDQEQRRAAVSTRHKLDGPPKEFIYDRLAHPPATFRQEKLKSDVRLPAARQGSSSNSKLNEIFPGPGERRHRRAGRPLQRADARAAHARPRRRVRRQPPADPRAERGLSRWCRRRSSTSPETRRPCWSSRKASRSSSSRRSPPSCAAPTCRRSCTARTSCTWRASTTSRRMVRGLSKFLGQHAPHLDTVVRRRVVEIRPEHQGEGRRSCSARCRCGRRRSASAARSGRCSRR